MNAKQTATQALQVLTHAAHRGDREAIAGLRDLALHAIAALESLTDAPAGHPDIPESIADGVAAAHELAHRSHRWPVRWDAIEENRKADFAQAERLEIGSAAAIELKGKRGMRYTQQTGFALDVFRELDAIRRNPERHRHIAEIHPELATIPGLPPYTWQNLAATLPPLAKGSLTAWADAGRELCRDWCENDWSRFPWPRCVQGKIGSITDENGNECGTSKAVRDKIFAGLGKLIP